MRAVLISIFSFFALSAAAQEAPSGGSTDSRIIINFKVADEKLRKILPAPWQLDPSATGPSVGANLKVTFADQLIGADASGKVGTGLRYVIFSIPVKHTDPSIQAYMIFGGLSPGGPGPYATNVKSTTTVERKLSSESNKRMTEESWDLVGEDGSTVSLKMRYEAGQIDKHKAAIRNYSQRKPEFSRIYRYEEAEDIVFRSDADAKRLQKFSFSGRGGVLNEIFDGNERLVSLSAIPWFSREVFLPQPRRP